MHSVSAGQDKQFVAAPASGGLRDFLKYVTEPVDKTKAGR